MATKRNSVLIFSILIGILAYYAYHKTTQQSLSKPSPDSLHLTSTSLSSVQTQQDPSLYGLGFNTTADIELFEKIITLNNVLPYLVNNTLFTLLKDEIGFLSRLTSFNINTLIKVVNITEKVVSLDGLLPFGMAFKFINGNLNFLQSIGNYNIATLTNYMNLLNSLWVGFNQQFGLNEIGNVGAKVTFFNNVAYIFAQNQLNLTYHLGVNALSALTLPEYIAYYNLNNAFKPDRPQATHVQVTQAIKPKVQQSTVATTSTSGSKYPIDWRQSNSVTSVKNQGQCGSCYTFSAAAAMESCNIINHKVNIDISEQQFVDCSSGYGNDGCNGGNVNLVYNYTIANGGAASLTSYPYTSGTTQTAGTCNTNTSPVATVTGYTWVSEGDTNDLFDKLTVGPVAIAIDASHASFQSYASGVYNEPACGNTQSDLDHAVLIVGWNQMTVSGTTTAYWIVKNSWDVTWGVGGYIYMEDTNNMCGVATYAMVPTC